MYFVYCVVELNDTIGLVLADVIRFLCLWVRSPCGLNSFKQSRNDTSTWQTNEPTWRNILSWRLLKQLHSSCHCTILVPPASTADWSRFKPPSLRRQPLAPSRPDKTLSHWSRLTLFEWKQLTKEWLRSKIYQAYSCLDNRTLSSSRSAFWNCPCDYSDYCHCSPMDQSKNDWLKKLSG